MGWRFILFSGLGYWAGLGLGGTNARGHPPLHGLGKRSLGHHDDYDGRLVLYSFSFVRRGQAHGLLSGVEETGRSLRSRMGGVEGKARERGGQSTLVVIPRG